MLERELTILRWVFLFVWIALLVMGGTFAFHPEYALECAQKFFASASLTRESGPFGDIYYAFTLSYFVMLLLFTLRIWKDPENHFRDLKAVLFLLMLPILFMARAFIESSFGALHLLLLLYFGSLAFIVGVFRRRLQSVLAQKQIFRPLK